MNNADWQARAATWELLALSFRYPGPELAGVVASGEWAEAAEELAAALGLEALGGFDGGQPGYSAFQATGTIRRLSSDGLSHDRDR